jgi:quercetin dioxygenase-like cupin family protein
MCLSVQSWHPGGMPRISLPIVDWAEPNRFPAGARIPLHRHEDVNELHLVAAGRWRSRIDGRELTSGPGTAVLYPCGCVHADAVDGAQPVATLFVP